MPSTQPAIQPTESAEKRIAILEQENLMLRQRLNRAESDGLGINETAPSQSVLQALEVDRRQLIEALEPVHFKRSSGINYNDLPTYPVRPHFEQATSYPGTQVVVFDGCPNDPYHASSTPIYQTATFVQPDIERFGPYDYTRSGNPTRTSLETLLALLEGAYAAFAFTSGMAALHTLVNTLSANDAVLASSDLYGGMHRLLTQVTARLGIEVVFAATWDLKEVEHHLRTNPRIKLLHIESPTNPLMRIVDIRALCQLAHAHNAEVSIDNTMMTPLRCTPIALGCDYVIHSATKFLCGHSDTMGGVVCVRTEAHARCVGFLQNAQGNALAPFDCWLLLRGIKTLSVRLDRQEANALHVAHFLAKKTHVVKRLHYAGLDPLTGAGIISCAQADFDLHRSQTSGPGSVLSIELGDVERSKRFLRACKLFKLTVSFGSCNSLVEMPCLLSHASIPEQDRTLPADLVRLSIGIEQIEDILADLRQAIEAAASVE